MEEQTLSAMHTLVKEHLQPVTIPVTKDTVLVTSDGQTVHDLDLILEQHLPYPLRPRGTSKHDTLESLITHAERHKGANSVAFCSLADSSPRLVVVYDYHPSDNANGGWKEYRSSYEFPFSEPWKRWVIGASGSLSVQGFAELLENGIGDVRDPASVEDAPVLPGVTFATPAELLTLAQGLTVRVDQTVANHQRLENGAAQITFSEEHETRGRDDKPMRVPNGFLLGLQPFIGGPAYPVPARLRYRVKDRQISWQIVLHDASGVRREAIEAAAERFQKETNLPLFYGTPDA